MLSPQGRRSICDARAGETGQAAPPGECPPPIHRPSRAEPDRTPTSDHRPNQAETRVDADIQRATEDWPAAPDQAPRPGGNPSQLPRTQQPNGQISPDPLPRSGHHREHRARALNHPGAARNSPEHDLHHLPNGTKMVVIQRQSRPGQHPAPSTDHVPATTHGQHEYQYGKTTTNPGNCVDHGTKENSAPVNSQAQTGTSRTGLAGGTSCHHACRTPVQRHPHQQAKPTLPTSAHLKVKHRAPDSMRKTRGYPRFNENAPTSVRTDMCEVSLNLGGISAPRRHAGQRRHVTKRGHNLSRGDIQHFYIL
ncbi:Uncharacterised protein [Mycobacteroides abscessus]|nr:Uncharacterised protein [Mycobacteroides abscessus]SHP01966.1 Uncharacterised protein [Mycobacteroides abscessus subsp. abscessus]CPT26188.1 Uncharacterised protein [Mycobacteroides abscessus]CPT26392.1 Uncharacterised protein [Mycobacteroides abscessus]CPU20421.1 Uncharacterised protein [Mycobacteroides abscessus]